jgi:hypothetical protein
LDAGLLAAEVVGEAAETAEVEMVFGDWGLLVLGASGEFLEHEEGDESGAELNEGGAGELLVAQVLGG